MSIRHYIFGVLYKDRLINSDDEDRLLDKKTLSYKVNYVGTT
jgi:hypothetical protein